jgi:hypothetical protein
MAALLWRLALLKITSSDGFIEAPPHPRLRGWPRARDLPLGTVTLVHKKSDAEAGGSGAAAPWPPAPQTASMVGSPSHSSAGSYMIYMYFVQSFR